MIFFSVFHVWWNRWAIGGGSYSEDGLYGADAVVSRAPVATVVVEALLQDVLVPWEVHVRVGHPSEHETEAERKCGRQTETRGGGLGWCSEHTLRSARGWSECWCRTRTAPHPPQLPSPRTCAPHPPPSPPPRASRTTPAGARTDPEEIQALLPFTRRVNGTKL